MRSSLSTARESLPSLGQVLALIERSPEIEKWAMRIVSSRAWEPGDDIDPREQHELEGLLGVEWRITLPRLLWLARGLVVAAEEGAEIFAERAKRAEALRLQRLRAAEEAAAVAGVQVVSAGENGEATSAAATSDTGDAASAEENGVLSDGPTSESGGS